MKVQIVSDHHLDGKDLALAGPPTRVMAGVLVVAGDVGSLKRVKTFMDSAAQRWAHIVYVPGNHEYYGDNTTMDWIRTDLKLMMAQWDNVHMLDDDVVIIDGQRFVGSTLWASPTMSAIKNYPINVSEVGDRAFGRRLMGVINQRSKRFLHAMVRPGDVVVTHFMPMMPDVVRAMAPYRYEKCDNEDYFGNTGLDNVMLRAPLWISGHTHSAFDVTVLGGACRWVCNPVGHCYEATGGDPEGVVVDLNRR